MLYNKNWDAKTITSDPLSLEGFIAWLETRDPNEQYDYMNCRGGCLYGQYMKSHGYSWRKADRAPTGSPVTRFQMMIYFEVAAVGPYTFGAALTRARAALAAR